ncbi:SRPBCC family protein [Marinicella sp. W31]|uniref:SRPBCC family protein n=1 Tax=Marinicella sp. W31 TaxID=3023713 RepID=UPI003757BE0E
MRILKYMILALFFLAAVFFAVGFFFLPSEREVSRSIEIDRPAKMVFKTINSMHTFNAWSPWAEIDPETQYTFTGPETGIGSKMSWKSVQKQVGSGTQEIIESQPNKMIKTKLYFDGQGDGPSYARLIMNENNGKTTVDWVFNTDFGDDVIGRYIGTMMDKMLGPQYESGLNNLKTLVEAQPVYDFTPASIETIAPMNILYVSGQANGTPEEISAVLGQDYQKILTTIAEQNLQMTSQPLTITRNMDAQGWTYDAAIPVNASSVELDINSHVKLGQTYGGKVVKYVQVGPYSLAPTSYKILNAYIEDQELEAVGDPWEVYISDPTSVAESEIITHLYQPVK